MLEFIVLVAFYYKLKMVIFDEEPNQWAQKIFRNTKHGAESTWSCTKNLEKTGKGCIGMKVIQKRLLNLMLIMTLLKKMILTSHHTGSKLSIDLFCFPCL